MIPKSNDKCPRRHEETKKQNRRIVGMETENGVPQPQIKQPPGAGRGKGLSPRALEGAQPCRHPDFGLLDSRIMTE